MAKLLAWECNTNATVRCIESAGKHIEVLRSAISLADACLIHLASEVGTGDIFSLDHDFKVFPAAGSLGVKGTHSYPCRSAGLAA